MKKLKTRDSIGWLFRFIILIEIIIIILILLRSYNKKMIIFNGNGANSGSMKNIIAYSDEKVEIKENKFTKDGYNFDGWNLYNDKDSTWKCEEGWFSEKEIEENNYKVLFYSTEDINDYFNLMNKGKVTAVAKWSKSSDVTEENLVSTTEEIANVETKTEEIKVEKSNNIKAKVEEIKEETKEESKVEETKCINHSYEVKITKKASCSENGTKTYICSKCKDTYTEAIPKLEHEYELKIKKAGCEEDGAKIYTCINCQDTYQEIIPMTGHNYETYVYKNPTCSQIGILVHKCIVCEKIITENIPKLEHNYEEKIIKEATIKEEGLKKFICKECNSSYEEEIPKLIPTDLDILKENLIGAILDGTEMGKEETIEEVTIRFDGKILFEGEGTENFKIYNKIEYNGNEYSIIVDGNTGTIIDVKNKEEEKFKFGEPYTSINQSEAYTYTIEKNGDFVGYEDGKYMGEEKEFIIIYENKVYIKYEDNMYTITGEVKEDGNKVIITSDNEIIELIYDPDFKAIEDKPDEGETEPENPEDETNAKVPLGFYELKQDGQANGGIITISNKEAIVLAGNNQMYLPFWTLYIEEGIYEAQLTNGEKIKVSNPIFNKVSWIGSTRKTYYVLWGYFEGNKLVTVNVDYSSDTSNWEDGGKIKQYNSIRKDLTIPKGEYSIDNLHITETYSTTVTSEGNSNIVGISQTDKVIYMGASGYGGYDFYFAGPSKYEIREDFVATLDDGTTIDFTGKQVIFAERLSDGSPVSGEYNPFGYIEGNTLILFDVTVSQRDENGFANMFTSITEQTSMVFNKR